MPEEKVEVKTIMVYLICECGCEMNMCSDIQATFPPRYSYQCPKCKRIEISESVYPRVEYARLALHELFARMF